MRARGGYATKLSEEEILEQAEENKRTPGWLQPKDVNSRNVKQCVSLVRAVMSFRILRNGRKAIRSRRKA